MYVCKFYYLINRHWNLWINLIGHSLYPRRQTGLNWKLFEKYYWNATLNVQMMYIFNVLVVLTAWSLSTKLSDLDSPLTNRVKWTHWDIHDKYRRSFSDFHFYLVLTSVSLAASVHTRVSDFDMNRFSSLFLFFNKPILLF